MTPTNEQMALALEMFEKLADDLRDLRDHWQQVPVEYADRPDYCRGRADGLQESVLAIRQVVKNANRDACPPPQQGDMVQVPREVASITAPIVADQALTALTFGKCAKASLLIQRKRGRKSAHNIRQATRALYEAKWLSILAAALRGEAPNV